MRINKIITIIVLILIIGIGKEFNNDSLLLLLLYIYLFFALIANFAKPQCPTIVDKMWSILFGYSHRRMYSYKFVET